MLSEVYADRKKNKKIMMSKKDELVCCDEIKELKNLYKVIYSGSILIYKNKRYMENNKYYGYVLLDKSKPAS